MMGDLSRIGAGCDCYVGGPSIGADWSVDQQHACITQVGMLNGCKTLGKACAYILLLVKRPVHRWPWLDEQCQVHQIKSVGQV